MKKWLPWLLVAVIGAWALSALRPAPPKNGFNLDEFGRLPVLLNGRIQPFDSVARNALLSMSGKSVVRVKVPKQLTGARAIVATLSGTPKASDTEWWVTSETLSPTEWILEAMTRPDLADTRKIFRVQDRDIEAMLGTTRASLEHYALNDLTNHLVEIQQQISKITAAEKQMDPKLVQRTPFQKDLFHLYDSLILFQRIKSSLQPEGARDFAFELGKYKEYIPAGLAALQASESEKDANSEDLQVIAGFFRRYQSMARFAYPLAVPPLMNEPREGWHNVGDSLMTSLRSQEIHPAITLMGDITTAYGKGEAPAFNQAVAKYKLWLQSNQLQPELKKGRQEYLFNQFSPFYQAVVIYVLALILGCVFWMNFSEPVRRSAYYLLMLAFVIHTFGLVFRMYLEGRPPVTNLYSSAIFVGWGAVLFGLVLERIFKGGIGLVTAATVGFVTQIIAHHLSLSGDTMEMLRAVLDTNFWLATHVVIITIGYASMFVAGFLAVIYILLGFFTKRLTQPLTIQQAHRAALAAAAVGSHTLGHAILQAQKTAAPGESFGKTLSRMVYGIVCFATLFSFVGTILGGIWADQSWGRFWGWDPKENGALLIVIWCAIILHARWGGIIRERGLMALAIFGNIVTSFSWFGVNMLGVGLHSYGFMDAAFQWLVGFVISQVLLIGLCCLPPRYWASFKQDAEKPVTPPSSPETVFGK